MSTHIFSEDTVEQAALEWIQSLGYAYQHGGELSRINPSTGLEDYGRVILDDQLLAALTRFNPSLPHDVIEGAFNKAMRSRNPDPIEDNRLFHRMLVDGIDVEYRHRDGGIRGDKVWLIDFTKPPKQQLLCCQPVHGC